MRHRNRTAEDRPRDRKRSPRAKRATIHRKAQRAAKRSAQGR